MTGEETGAEGTGSGPALIVHIVTLFPHLFDSWLGQGVVSRAVGKGIASIHLTDLRQFGVGRHQVTDDYPFGGGAGMVMKPEPLFSAVDSLQRHAEAPVILLSPQGTRFDQGIAESLARLPEFVLLAGHYEGVDERVREHAITDELSIGDYVLSAGELAAMVVCDAVVRLLPGALTSASTAEESFAEGLLEYPQYTRPAVYRGWSVPEILLSGNHGEIARWRRRMSLRQTFLRRPELLRSASLNADERKLVLAWELESEEPGPSE